jgi:hypothetical protein
VFLAGSFAPLEAPGWRAGWFGGRDVSSEWSPLEPPAGDDENSPKQYLVFLSGIHSVNGATFANREKQLLEMLRAELPDTQILEVFPYSVTNRPLTGQRLFAWFWRWALSMKLSKRTLAGVAGTVINMRNIWQMGVSADRRYGPIYNRGSAMLILDALRRAGCRRGKPILLVGYSGGGQIALGAAPHVESLSGGPVTVVSLGGVMSSDPATRRLERVYDLHGERDRVYQAGILFFPGRWPLFPQTSWNQAKRAGIVRSISLGPPDHTGRGGYLDSQSTLPDGRSYLKQSVDVLAAIARREDPSEVAFGERAR